ncbi:DUF3006 domain-containing protein [Oceanobacillus sp. CAU 1775]
MKKGVLDRFEGEQAVILVEEDHAEFIVHQDKLPANSEKNTIFKVEKQVDGYQIIAIDEAATKSAQAKSSDLMNKLRAKSSGSKFKRK